MCKYVSPAGRNPHHEQLGVVNMLILHVPWHMGRPEARDVCILLVVHKHMGKPYGIWTYSLFIHSPAHVAINQDRLPMLNSQIDMRSFLIESEYIIKDNKDLHCRNIEARTWDLLLIFRRSSVHWPEAFSDHKERADDYLMRRDAQSTSRGPAKFD